MPKKFTNQEKIIISNNIFEQAKMSWQKHGYKKTSIDDICKNVGISKGAFYIFFDTKESLFYKILKNSQEEIINKIEKTISKNQNKLGVLESLKIIYNEYSNSKFIYDNNSPDFLSFFNKLEDYQRTDILQRNRIQLELIIKKSSLNLKISYNLAISVFIAILNNIYLKDNNSFEHSEIFNFIIESLIDDIFY